MDWDLAFQSPVLAPAADDLHIQYGTPGQGITSGIYNVVNDVVYTGSGSFPSDREPVSGRRCHAFPGRAAA